MAALRQVTMSKQASISAVPDIWQTCSASDAAWTMSPRPSGYHGSMIESWPMPTVTPACQSSFTRVIERRFG